jgi:L-glyceraldehyde 3-phosphate reductase
VADANPTTRQGYVPATGRYETMEYRRTGNSGLKLPALSLGFWHNFGPDAPLERQRAIVCRAFDLGVTHLDLANNYGPPAGSAEENLARILATDLRSYRDELVISTKAGYDMWPGPYGEWGYPETLQNSKDIQSHLSILARNVTRSRCIAQLKFNNKS